MCWLLVSPYLFYLLLGKPTSDRVIKKVAPLADVVLRQNDKAYINGPLFTEYLEECIPAELRCQTIVTFDNFPAHLSEDVLAKVKELGFALAELPPNSTWAIQPLDVAINRPVKEGVRGEYRDEYVRRHRDPEIKGRWKVSHNWVVSKTQRQFRLAATRMSTMLSVPVGWSWAQRTALTSRQRTLTGCACRVCRAAWRGSERRWPL